MAFSFPPNSPFGQTSSCSSTPFGSTPKESSSVFAENISSPFGRSNSSSFGGFQNTTISGDSASTPRFGSPCPIIGVEPATSFGSSAVNSNSSTTSIFGESNPSTTPSLWSTAASGNSSASGPSFWSTPVSGNTSAFGVQSSSSGLTSCFKTGDNQAKLFQSPFSSLFQAPTTPPLFSPFGSTSASENTSAFGVQQPTGYVPRPFPSPFCSNTSTANIFGPTTSSTTTHPFSKPAPSFVQPPSSVFPSGPGLVANSLSQPPQSSNGSTMFKDVGNQTINGQQQELANPFGLQYEIVGSNAIITIQNGTSSIQISGEISSLTIRQVSSRHDRLPARGHVGGSSEPCSANSQIIFQDTKASGVSPSNARFGDKYSKTPEDAMNGHRGQINSISAMPIYRDKSHEELRLKDYELQWGKGCEGKASFKLNLNEIEVNDEEEDDAAIKKREAEVLTVLPKLRDGDYYTEPSIKDLAAKEMAEPGFCSRVNDFVVGRKDYGSIKFLGETDIRHLDIQSVIRFDNREVIVYPDDRKKPPLGQSLNKPAEVTLLNVKCVSKKTGKEYVDGAQVQSYKKMLIKKASENGAEFVSYDPIQGKWKFRVPHF